MVLCDIGNSTFSFLIDDNSFVVDIENSSNLPKIDKKIYFISVNKKATKIFQKKYPKAIDLAPYIKLKTKYKGLGVDRALVCSHIKNGIVIDVGSAITIDIVDDNKHLGGFILAGFKAYKKSYEKISKKLKFDYKNFKSLNKLPKNTQEAINLAILNGIVLQINNLAKQYDKTIYLTGGDALMIKKYLNKDTIYRPNMIFKTMKKIIKKGL